MYLPGDTNKRHKNFNISLEIWVHSVHCAPNIIAKNGDDGERFIFSAVAKMFKGGGILKKSKSSDFSNTLRKWAQIPGFL